MTNSGTVKKWPKQVYRRRWVMAHWLTEAMPTARKAVRKAYNLEYEVEGADEARIEALKEFRDWCLNRIAEVDSVLADEEAEVA